MLEYSPTHRLLSKGAEWLGIHLARDVRRTMTRLKEGA